jgi:hypothetical protein
VLSRLVGVPALIVAGLALSATGELHGAAVPMLGSVADVLRLTNDEAGGHIPVRLRAGVTLAKPDSYWLFLQDGAAGIYVIAAPSSDVLRRGDLVELEGFTERGGFAPIVKAKRINVVGNGPLPPPFLLATTPCLLLRLTIFGPPPRAA